MFDEFFQLFPKLSPKKIYNIWLNLQSYYSSKHQQISKHKGLPISLAIEPTTSCNLRCPECPSGLRSFTRPTGMLQEDIFKKVIDELQDTLLYLTFYFQGEPYLHPKFTELVKYASDRKIYTSTSTNAHYLTDENARKTVESGLDKLIISIDGSTQETYQQYRIGGKLEKVLAGTEKIVAWKKKLVSKTPQVIFQFLVVKPNEHQIAEVYQLAKKYQVDGVQLKTAQIYDFENGSALMPTNSKYSRYQLLSNGKYAIKNSLENNCWKMWQSAVITWDGTVVPCCFDKDATHKLGNVATNDFKTIWEGELYQKFRQQLLISRSKIEMCKNCTEGTKVFA
jgi:radical SAM protein with 4Fe4S-binding SPASM domain